jgi:predicted DNA-binding ribbon-helix-helix protein
MDCGPINSRLINRNIVAASGRSSMRLEPEIWDALFEICRRENVAMGELVRKVDGGREVGGRTSAIRVFAFNYFRQAATEDGHRLAGHGASTSAPAGQPAPAPTPARW